MNFFKDNKVYLKIFLIVLAVGCYLISQMFCYYFVDDFASHFFSQIYQFTMLRIILCNILFFILYYLLKLSTIKEESIMKYLFILCLVAPVILSLRPSPVSTVNFNILDFRQIWNSQSSTKFLFLANCMMYLPLGIFYQGVTKEKTIASVIDFIIFISFVELCQYHLQLGAFDVFDILCNTIGFVIGLLICKYAKKIWGCRNVEK